MNDLELRVSRIVKAPIERVFSAWLDPGLLARFMLPGDGMSVPEVEIDPVEGGRFRIVMKAGEKELPHSGTYKKIKPHSQLVFTWESEFSVDGSTVTLDLSSVEGGTLVELTQVTFFDEGARDQHLGGWTQILSRLESAAG